MKKTLQETSISDARYFSKNNKRINSKKLRAAINAYAPFRDAEGKDISFDKKTTHLKDALSLLDNGKESPYILKFPERLATQLEHLGYDKEEIRANYPKSTQLKFDCLLSLYTHELLESQKQQAFFFDCGFLTSDNKPAVDQLSAEKSQYILVKNPESFWYYNINNPQKLEKIPLNSQDWKNLAKIETDTNHLTQEQLAFIYKITGHTAQSPEDMQVEKKKREALNKQEIQKFADKLLAIYPSFTFFERVQNFFSPLITFMKTPSRLRNALVVTALVLITLAIVAGIIAASISTTGAFTVAAAATATGFGTLISFNILGGTAALATGAVVGSLGLVGGLAAFYGFSLKLFDRIFGLEKEEIKLPDTQALENNPELLEEDLPAYTLIAKKIGKSENASKQVDINKFFEQLDFVEAFNGTLSIRENGEKVTFSNPEEIKNKLCLIKTNDPEDPITIDNYERVLGKLAPYFSDEEIKSLRLQEVLIYEALLSEFQLFTMDNVCEKFGHEQGNEDKNSYIKTICSRMINEVKNTETNPVRIFQNEVFNKKQELDRDDEDRIKQGLTGSTISF